MGRFIIYIVILLVATTVTSFSGGSIRGTIKDSSSGAPIAGATIRIEGTGFGASTNKDGRFFIKKAPTGKVTLLVSSIGYNTLKKIVQLKDDDTLNIEIFIIEQQFQTTEVVVSANRRVQAVQDVPISVSVVDQRAIQQRNVTKLDEVLRYVPGVNVSGFSVSIRGSSGFSYGLGSRVSLMLDNFPLLSADNGDMAFDALPMFDVERIEVVKGAGSALYGTSALGGVINVLTREPKEFAEVKLRTFTGIYTLPRFEQWRYRESLPILGGIDASFSQKFGQLGVIASGGYKSDQGYREYTNSQRFNFFNKYSYAHSAYTTINAFVQYSQENRDNWVNWRSQEFATRPPLTADLSDIVRSRKFAVGADYRTVFNDETFLIARASMYRTWYENSVSSSSPNFVAADARSINTEAQLNSKFTENVYLTSGITLLRNDVSSPYIDPLPDGTWGSRGQLIASLYSQAEISNNRNVILTLGGRLDREETFGEAPNLEFSPKMGLSFKAFTGTNFRASVGRAFRAASITEKFAALRFGPFQVQRNIELRSEKSWSFELGGQQTFEIFGSPWQADVAIFQNEMYDLVEPQLIIGSAGIPVIQFSNVTRARIQGVEAGLKGWIGNQLLGIEATVTAMNPRDLTKNITLRYRHPIMFTSRFLVPITTGLEFHADYRYLQRVENIDDEIVNAGLVVNGDARVAIHVVDARLLYDISKTLPTLPMTLSLNARNLFDYYYVEIIGNLGQTRQLTLQADVRL
jgi:outer membrane receptor for ferrienterochelin and colicins